MKQQVLFYIIHEKIVEVDAPERGHNSGRYQLQDWVCVVMHRMCAFA